MINSCQCLTRDAPLTPLPLQSLWRRNDAVSAVNPQVQLLANKINAKFNANPCISYAAQKLETLAKASARLN
ncbi:MAG: hypothetical protein JWR26_3104 [Pedosphaera sp.]|nr:hypothetical protein [Pedosphaera sp.]